MRGMPKLPFLVAHGWGLVAHGLTFERTPGVQSAVTGDNFFLTPSMVVGSQLLFCHALGT